MGFRVSWRFVVADYAFRCDQPPDAAIIDPKSPPLVGSSGEIIVFTYPRAGRDVKVDLGGDCV